MKTQFDSKNPHWSSGLPEIGTVGVVIGEVMDYEFDCVAVIQNNRGFHVVSSSGCSCPTHEEQAVYESGPHPTIEDTWPYIPESHRSGDFDNLTLMTR